MVELYTSRWQNRELERLPVVAVGISRGVPKFRVSYRYRRLMELASDGWMLGIEDDARFEQVYIRKLERLGVDRIAALLQRISDEEGGRALALLCYEDVHAGEVCHRTMFSAWWEQKTGQQVPELESRGRSRNLPPAQDAQEPLF